jgi:hypothetical protein
MRTLRSVDTLRIAILAVVGLSSCKPATRPGLGDDDDGSDASTAPEAARGDGGNPFPCTSPTPVVVAGVDTGYDRCDSGVVRRRAIIDCPVAVPRAGVSEGCPAGDGGYQCTSDRDCSSQHGACFRLQTEFAGESCQCVPGCARDSDCGPDQICVCGDLMGTCEDALCRPGACGAGFECADYNSSPGCPGLAFACQASGDECATDVDCSVNTQCSFDTQAGARRCLPEDCAVGRPFLVDGESRLPPVASRDDWRLLPGVPRPVTGPARERLASTWLTIARMEYASIAAFARFALQLLAVGAPPDLVLGAQRAMADETEHARLAFGLASAYAGQPVGPGPLAVDACLDAVDLRAIVATVFAEGCVGETAAAIEAHEALAEASDPAVRAVLETIARDETVHAELAWRTLAWAIAGGGAPIRDAVRALANEAAIAIASETAGEPSLANGAAPDDGLPEHGVLGAAERTRIRRAAIERVVVPCIRELLAAPGLQSSRTGSDPRVISPFSCATASVPSTRSA